jgi:hypothetical protein
MVSRRRLYWLVGLGVLGLCAVPSVRWTLHRLEYSREQRVTYELVKQLRQRRPAAVAPLRWDAATSWAVTAYVNVCFSPEHVSLEELKRFRADLEQRLRGPVDLETVDWFWHRLGRTGPHGRGYHQRNEPLHRQALGLAPEHG